MRTAASSRVAIRKAKFARAAAITRRQFLSALLPLLATERSPREVGDGDFSHSQRLRQRFPVEEVVSVTQQIQMAQVTCGHKRLKDMKASLKAHRIFCGVESTKKEDDCNCRCQCAPTSDVPPPVMTPEGMLHTVELKGWYRIRLPPEQQKWQTKDSGVGNESPMERNTRQETVNVLACNVGSKWPKENHGKIAIQQDSDEDLSCECLCCQKTLHFNRGIKRNLYVEESNAPSQRHDPSICDCLCCLNQPQLLVRPETHKALGAVKKCKKQNLFSVFTTVTSNTDNTSTVIREPVQKKTTAAGPDASFNSIPCHGGTSECKPSLYWHGEPRRYPPWTNYLFDALTKESTIAQLRPTREFRDQHLRPQYHR